MTKTTWIALLVLLLAGGVRAQEGKPPELPGVPTSEMTPEEKAAADAWAAEALAVEEKSPQGRVRRRLKEAAEKARKADEKARAATKRKVKSGSAADKASREAAAEKARADEEAADAEAARAAAAALSDAESAPLKGTGTKVEAPPEPKREEAAETTDRKAQPEPRRAPESEAAANARAAARSVAGDTNAAARPAPVANYVEQRDLSRRAPLTSGQALLRSAFIPGLGQIQTGRPIRGYTFLTAAGLSLGSTIWMTARAAQANNVYENAPASVRMQAYDQARSYAATRNTMIAMTAIIWTVNAAEAYFLNGTTDR